jgi:hypothetical protein
LRAAPVVQRAHPSWTVSFALFDLPFAVARIVAQRTVRTSAVPIANDAVRVPRGSVTDGTAGAATAGAVEVSATVIAPGPASHSSRIVPVAGA